MVNVQRSAPVGAVAIALLVTVLVGVEDQRGSGLRRAEASTQFSDVGSNHPFVIEIDWLAGTGVARGYSDGTFRGTAPVSRQAMAAFLYRFAGASSGPNPTCVTAAFVDVGVGHPFCGEIAWLAGSGITTGYDDGRFRGGWPVSRQAMAAFLYRYAGSPSGANPTCVTAAFVDVGVGHPFCGEIAWLVARGVTTGYDDGRFRGGWPVSRQAMAAFLYRYAVAPAIGPGRIATGYAHSCAVTSAATVRCWGTNGKGQLGDGSVAQRPTPVLVSGLTGVSQVVAGSGHTCALRTDGTVRCWGENAAGQLGNGTTSAGATTAPVTVGGLSGVTQLTAGADHTCARRSDGTVRCWGANADRQLGDGTIVSRSTPVAVAGLTGVAEVSAGAGHTCARRTDGTVRCWGNNGAGQMGDGTNTNRAAPVTVTGLSNVTQLSSGANHVCARRSDGTVRCWGQNSYGKLGDGTTTTRLSPVTVSGLSGVSQVSAGRGHTCARLTNGTARCWGWNQDGQIGDGTSNTIRHTPVAVSLGSVAQVAAGGSDTGGHTCAVLTNATVRCWGWNVAGQLGDGTLQARSTPVAVLLVS